MLKYNHVTTTGDRATQKCDPSTVVMPYGMGLASQEIPTLYDYADGFKAINFSLARGCLGSKSTNFFR